MALGVLFSGTSGTGKTMAAEVLANELKLEIMGTGIDQTDTVWKVRISDKEFLSNAAKRRIGDDSAAPFDALLTSKTQTIGLRRADTPENQRKDFYVYKEVLYEEFIPAYFSVYSTSTMASD